MRNTTRRGDGMSFKETKTAVVSARLYESTKRKLDASGYTAAEAIKWFVDEYYSSKSAKKLKIKRDILTQNLESLQKDNEMITKEIRRIEFELSQLDVSENNVDIDVNIDECLHLPSIVIEGISTVQNAYNRKKEHEPLNDIEDFMNQNQEFMISIWDKHGKPMDFDNFCDLVREHVEDNVYNVSKQLRKTS